MRRESLKLNASLKFYPAVKLLSALAALLFFSSCGYRFSFPSDPKKPRTVSVPYVVGDTGGVFADALIQALSATGRFLYMQEGGDLTLQVAILSNSSDKIGYQYDRKGRRGKREKNLVSTEGRQNLTAQVTLVDSITQDVLFGPDAVTAYADFDYVDYDSISDLSFINTQGMRQSSISFSLGQLDSIEGAQGDVTLLLYRELANKIVQGLLLQ